MNGPVKQKKNTWFHWLKMNRMGGRLGDEDKDSGIEELRN